MNSSADQYKEISENMPSEEQRIVEYNEILQYRLNSVLPGLLEEEEFDAWMVIGRENNEDPIIKTLLPGSFHGASRVTAFLFTKEERFVLSPYGSRMEEFYQCAWTIEEGDVFKSMAKLLRDLKIRTLGLNFSEDFALADGITHSLFESLRQKFDDHIHLVSAERIAVNWLQTRSDREIEVYRKLDRIAHTIIGNAFSRENIIPLERISFRGLQLPEMSKCD